MAEEVLVARQNGVMRITMNRPHKKNAITNAMYATMTAALGDAEVDDGIRVVLIEGSGGAFTAGNDMADFLSLANGGVEFNAPAFIKEITVLSKPLVAAVEGVAVGVGTTLLFHCDLVYATPTAKFRMPFVDLGLVPEAGSTLLVPARIGLAKASEFLLLTDGFDAEEALRLGLVNALVPSADLAETAFNAACRLAAKPIGALRATRRLMRGGSADILAAFEREIAAFGEALTSAEARAAFEAFLGKCQ
jgi:enoyl-CoA hydratase/carnithine racemase